MSQKRLKNKGEKNDESEKTNNDIKVASINLKAAIIVAILGLIGTITAAMIASGSRTDNVLPTANPVSTSVNNTSVTASGTKCVYPPRYGFECGQYGWTKTSYFQNQAIQAVTTTQSYNKDGTPTQVLALTVDFTGPIAAMKTQNRESGEVLVDLNAFPPAGYEAKSVDLHGVTVVAWSWAPEGSTGDSSHKNGIQLFVKDGSDKNCYGAWQPIDQEKIWFQVHWQENNAAYCELGFDSSKPKLLGVKIAVGGNSNWTANDLLTFYVDDINW